MLRLAIIVNYNRIFLDMKPEGNAVTFERYNPMFHEKTDFNTSFELPFTDKNKAYLGQDYKFSAAETVLEYEAELYSNKTLVEIGKIKKQNGSGSFSVIFKSSSTDFYNISRGKKITELSYGGPINLGESMDSVINNFNGSTASHFPLYDYVLFPVLNTKQKKDTTIEADRTQCEDLFYQNYWEISQTFNLNYPLSPFPYIAKVIRSIFNESGYYIDKNCYELYSELLNLCIYNQNDFFVRGGATKYFYLKDHLPEILINEFLNYLNTFFASQIFINKQTKSVNIKLLKDVLANYEYNVFQFAKLASVECEYLDKKSGFIVSAKNDGLDKYWSDNIKSLPNMGDYYKGDVENYADLLSITASLGDIYFVKTRSIYYTYGKDANDVVGWYIYSYKKLDNVDNKAASNNLEITLDITTALDYNHDDKTKEWRTLRFYHAGDLVWYYPRPSTMWYICQTDHTSAGGTDLMDGSLWLPDYTHTHERFWWTPKVEISGNNPEYFSIKQKQNFGLRLLHYRGMDVDGSGNEYPRGSLDCWEQYGNGYILNKHALIWHSDRGINTNYQKEWIRYIMNLDRKYVIKMPMTHPEFSMLDFSQKQMIDDSLFFISMIRYTYTDFETSIAEITAYKAP